jgi:hypothetical protein
MRYGHLRLAETRMVCDLCGGSDHSSNAHRDAREAAYVLNRKMELLYEETKHTPLRPALLQERSREAWAWCKVVQRLCNKVGA